MGGPCETMDLQHVNVKIYVDGDLAVDPARFIEIFHGWIKEEAFDELLIDVADYRHVPDGPGERDPAEYCGCGTSATCYDRIANRKSTASIWPPRWIRA